VSKLPGEGAHVRGEHVWLRAFERSDLEPYRAAANHADTAAAGYNLPLGSEDVAAWYEEKVKRHGTEEYYFVISPLGSDEFLGTAWLWNFDSRLGGAEFSIFLADPKRRGAGLGTDAINAALDFGFGSLELEKVWLTTDVDNEPAKRAFEKGGFKVDGVLRHHRVRHGVWIDAVLMSILREDWEALVRPRSWDFQS
jgi:RimJ/RimL family protein N-acetyltransferase